MGVGLHTDRHAHEHARHPLDQVVEQLVLRPLLADGRLVAVRTLAFVAFDQTPCRSGVPSGLCRGATLFTVTLAAAAVFDTDAGVCENAVEINKAAHEAAPTLRTREK